MAPRGTAWAAEPTAVAEMAQNIELLDDDNFSVRLNLERGTSFDEANTPKLPLRMKERYAIVVW